MRAVYELCVHVDISYKSIDSLCGVAAVSTHLFIPVDSCVLTRCVRINTAHDILISGEFKCKFECSCFEKLGLVWSCRNIYVVSLLYIFLFLMESMYTYLVSLLSRNTQIDCCGDVSSYCASIELCHSLMKETEAGHLNTKQGCIAILCIWILCLAPNTA